MENIKMTEMIFENGGHVKFASYLADFYTCGTGCAGQN